MVVMVMVVVVMVMVVIVMVVMAIVVMVIVVMAMVVEVTIDKKELIECMQYEKFASFYNLILHTVTLALHSHNTSLIANVHDTQS